VRLLAVDDERPALEDLAGVLRSTGQVGELELADSGGAALELVRTRPFDAIFLDVRMPDLDGVALARALRPLPAAPAVVFVSAYESAAVEAFELRALDYLVKPVSRLRVLEALERVRAAMAAADEEEVVAVDPLRGGGTRLISRDSIHHLEARGDYVRVVADDGRFSLRASLSDLERRWAPHGFVRVHRRYVVNLRRAVEVTPLLNGTAIVRFPGGDEVPVARRQAGDLRRRIRA
jgi:two-component system, LytTR family, response regulator LytT